jgi:uncharacterized membrane protein
MNRIKLFKWEIITLLILFSLAACVIASGGF